MSFLKSVLFGCEGSYNILGIQAKFENEAPSYFPSTTLEGAGFISSVAIKCMNSNVFRYMTQAYAHVLMHEMSHALAGKLLTGEDVITRVFKSSCTGGNEYSEGLRNVVDWKKTIILVAGPMGDVAFSFCKLITAIAFKDYLPWPITLTLGIGAVSWISGELLLASVSALNKDAGDFGYIARHGNSHLVLSSAALVSECILGIFGAISLSS